MDLRITARHFKAEDDLREYVAKQVSKLERYYDGITDVRVVLGLGQASSEERTAEINLNVYRQTLTAGEVAETHEEAVNQCVSSLKRQILRYKEKIRRKHKYRHTAEALREGGSPSA